MEKKTSRILLADDNRDSRSALALLLETRLGATIVGKAPTMEALLEQAAATHPDVVLLDWELPGKRKQIASWFYDASRPGRRSL